MTIDHDTFPRFLGGRLWWHYIPSWTTFISNISPSSSPIAPANIPKCPTAKC